MPLVVGMCDRILAMEAGAPIALGSPHEVVSDPQVVASYLGGDDLAIHRSGRSTALTSTGRAAS